MNHILDSSTSPENLLLLPNLSASHNFLLGSRPLFQSSSLSSSLTRRKSRPTLYPPLIIAGLREVDVKVQRSRYLEGGKVWRGQKERADEERRGEWAASEEATSRYAAVSIGSRRDSKRKPDKPGV